MKVYSIHWHTNTYQLGCIVSGVATPIHTVLTAKTRVKKF